MKSCENVNDKASSWPSEADQEHSGRPWRMRRALLAIPDEKMRAQALLKYGGLEEYYAVIISLKNQEVLARLLIAEPRRAWKAAEKLEDLRLIMQVLLQVKGLSKHSAAHLVNKAWKLNGKTELAIRAISQGTKDQTVRAAADNLLQRHFEPDPQREAWLKSCVCTCTERWYGPDELKTGPDPVPLNPPPCLAAAGDNMEYPGGRTLWMGLNNQTSQVCNLDPSIYLVHVVREAALFGFDEVVLSWDELRFLHNDLLCQFNQEKWLTEVPLTLSMGVDTPKPPQSVMELFCGIRREAFAPGTACATCEARGHLYLSANNEVYPCPGRMDEPLGVIKDFFGDVRQNIRLASEQECKQ